MRETCISQPSGRPCLTVNPVVNKKSNIRHRKDPPGNPIRPVENTFLLIAFLSQQWQFPKTQTFTRWAYTNARLSIQIRRNTLRRTVLSLFQVASNFLILGRGLIKKFTFIWISPNQSPSPSTAVDRPSRTMTDRVKILFPSYFTVKRCLQSKMPRKFYFVRFEKKSRLLGDWMCWLELILAAITSMIDLFASTILICNLKY